MLWFRLDSMPVGVEGAIEREWHAEFWIESFASLWPRLWFRCKSASATNYDTLLANLLLRGMSHMPFDLQSEDFRSHTMSDWMHFSAVVCEEGHRTWQGEAHRRQLYLDRATFKAPQGKIPSLISCLCTWSWSNTVCMTLIDLQMHALLHGVALMCCYQSQYQSILVCARAMLRTFLVIGIKGGISIHAQCCVCMLEVSTSHGMWNRLWWWCACRSRWPYRRSSSAAWSCSRTFKLNMWYAIYVSEG